MALAPGMTHKPQIPSSSLGGEGGSRRENADVIPTSKDLHVGLRNQNTVKEKPEDTCSEGLVFRAERPTTAWQLLCIRWRGRASFWSTGKGSVQRRDRGWCAKEWTGSAAGFLEAQAVLC